MKKVVAVLLIMSMCLSFAACANSDNSNSSTVEPKTESSKVEATPEPTVEPTVEPTEEPTLAPTETPKPTTEPVTSDNPLMNAEFETANVKSGSGDVIGQRGYILIDKSVLEGVTNEQMIEFATSCVDDSGLNWVSIICTDGTGVCFQGSMSMFFVYGTMDNEGGITDAGTTYMLKDGIYSK
ncbi:MAG: PT domain-containing protein [Oscillospiraceae bacterium]|nr:PT domain-containing protein [Oscillospiraceae bacterium]